MRRGSWVKVPIGSKMFTNIDETALTRANAAIENAFINEADGHTRFPGLETFADLGNQYRVYLNEWHGDLVAVTSGGTVHRINADGGVARAQGVLIDGGRRVTFAHTQDFLLLAAGGSIVSYDGYRSAVLSVNAPKASSIGYIDGYVIAVEADSGRFWHSQLSDPTQWVSTDVFSADSLPDDISAMLVTPMREIMLCGSESIEQWERFATGDVPFFRRWALGSGVGAPGTLFFEDNTTWAVNARGEFIRYSGQLSQVISGDVGLTLAGVSDWTDAWAQSVVSFGQTFVVLQIPRAYVPAYEINGITLVFDLRQQRWFTLYGWDDDRIAPSRWPGWSVFNLWGQAFVGGEGKVYRLSREEFRTGSSVQRMLGRTANISDWGPSRIDDVRMRLRRGTGSNVTSSEILLRVRRNGEDVSRWVSRDLGRAGQQANTVHFGGFGCADTWQFEWSVTDDTPVEVVNLEVQITPLDR